MYKPPLGARPAFITSRARIKELSDAVGRLAEDPNGDIELVRLWATEICSHCEIISRERLERNQRRTNVDNG